MGGDDGRWSWRWWPWERRPWWRPTMGPTGLKDENRSTRDAARLATADIDWNRARELHEKSQRGERLSAEDQAYLDRAKQAMAARQQVGGPPPKVDWTRVGEVYEKVRGGQACNGG